MQRILGIITIAGLSAACVAKPAQQQEWHAGGGKSTVSMQSSDGKDSYEVRIQDGKITAKRNGEEVPADRIVKTKDGDREVIEIRDENGNVVKTFDMTTVSGHRVHVAPLTTTLAPVARGGKIYTSSAPKARAGFRAADDGNVSVSVPDTMENPPPVMVGVTMAEPDEGVLEFLKLEKAVVFDRVIDDLPAAKAGLKAGDILVEVKGEKNINQERFREILRGMKPGDSLPIKIARSGAEMHDFTISLAAFDAKVLGRAEPKENGETWDVFTNKDSKKSWESAHKALEEAMARLKTEVKSEDAQKAVREALEKAMKAVEEAKESLRDVQLWSNGGQWAPQGSTRFRLNPGQNGLMVVPPTVPTPAVPDVDDERIQKLEKKVDDLNKKLDKIAKMLEERK